jgi:hypothetical protein
MRELEFLFLWEKRPTVKGEVRVILPRVILEDNLTGPSCVAPRFSHEYIPSICSLNLSTTALRFIFSEGVRKLSVENSSVIIVNFLSCSY